MDSERDYLVGFITVNIVDLKHYSATITDREILVLVREPLNPYDSNSIKILNTQSLQLGHIESSVAAVLSPLIDAQIIAVEGIVRFSPPPINKKFRIPIEVHVFANLSSSDAVQVAFNKSRVQFIAYTDPSFTLSHSIDVKETRVDNVNVNGNMTVITNPNSLANNLDDVFKLVHENLVAKSRVDEVLNPPDRIIKSELFRHQKEGLGWLFQRENSEELPPFWEEKEGNFINVLTHYQTNKRPEPLHGGIFADDMGLGKTLTLLSLIAFDKLQRKCGGKRKRGMLESKGTLIVCPPYMVSTWIAQLDEHTCLGALKRFIYYDDKRPEDYQVLQKYDLVLTTYSTLAAELRGRLDSPMKRLEWRRIVLDEAHTIENANAGLTKAVIALKAKQRWAVTGMPILNGSYDLFSLMAFLHFEPFSIKGYWQSLLQRPLNQGKQIGLTRLQV